LAAQGSFNRRACFGALTLPRFYPVKFVEMFTLPFGIEPPLSNLLGDEQLGGTV